MNVYEAKCLFEEIIAEDKTLIKMYYEDSLWHKVVDDFIHLQFKTKEDAYIYMIKAQQTIIKRYFDAELHRLLYSPIIYTVPKKESSPI